MKHLIALFCLITLYSVTATGQQVRIDNNTTCDIVVDVSPWDVCNTTPSFPGTNPNYQGYTIPAGQSVAFAGTTGTVDYDVDITVDPGGIGYVLPTVSVAGSCGSNRVDSAPTVACTPDVVEAVGSGGPTNWVIDVHPL